MATRVAILRAKHEHERKQRRLVRTLLMVLGVIALIGMFGVLNLPALRITEVLVRGEGAPHEAATALIRKQLAGSYIFVIPRDSIFLYPRRELARTLMRRFPPVGQVGSYVRSGTLTVVLTPRRMSYFWCGGAATSERCSAVDARHFAFALRSARAEGTLVLETGAVPREGVTVSPHASTTLALTRTLGAELTKAWGPTGAPTRVRIGEGSFSFNTVSGATIVAPLGGNAERLRAALSAALGHEALHVAGATMYRIDLRTEGKVFFSPQ